MATAVDEAVRQALEELDRMEIASPRAAKTDSLEFWQRIAEEAEVRADALQEEIDEHGEDDPPEESGSLSDDEDDPDDEDED